MKIKNINKIFHHNGNTSDIIQVVMYAYEIEDDPQIRVLADQLKGNTTYDTCKNIWQFLLDNVNYKADSDGDKGELIRTPARLLHDRVGDCKSYSLFTAVILRYLGIPHFFRFVSYNRIKRATHVYIVADNNIIIDAVASHQLNYPFNQEVKFTYRADMSERGTKISYLAGLSAANNAVGNLDDDRRYIVFTNNEQEDEITPGKAWLYAKFDLLIELINIEKNKKELARLYDELAIISAFIWAYDYVDGDTEEFEYLALNIVALIAEGVFLSKETAPDKRNIWFDNILNIIPIQRDIDQINLSWWNLIKSEVIHKNELIEPSEVSNISGWRTPIANALKKAGIYFLYIFIPEADLKKYPAVVTKKRKVQNNIFKVINKIVFRYSADSIKSFFRSGIIARTGMTPENYIKAVVKENKSNNINAAVSTLAVIATVLGIIISLIQIISMLFPRSDIAEYNYKDGVPDVGNELKDITPPSVSKKDGDKDKKKNQPIEASSLLLGLGLLGSFLLTSKKKQK